MISRDYAGQREHIRRCFFVRHRSRQPIVVEIIVTLQDQEFIRHPAFAVPPVAVQLAELPFGFSVGSDTKLQQRMV
ncbi:hypothetical protein D3C79_884470 [compost metagenome]